LPVLPKRSRRYRPFVEDHVGRPKEEFRLLADSILPEMGLLPGRFRTKNVMRRIRGRLTVLHLHSFRRYAEFVRENPPEKELLSTLLVITISRFFRNEGVFRRFQSDILAALPRPGEGGAAVRLWSAGCAGGEEPYSLAILLRDAGWDRGAYDIIATDVDEPSMKRARLGVYGKGSLKEVEPSRLDRHFEKRRDVYLLSRAIRESVTLLKHDILRDPIIPGVSAVFCRNLAFTYFDREGRHRTAALIHQALLPGGFLVIGKKEQLPAETLSLFRPAYPTEKIYRRVP
jgi:chemotaxis methyl-accepting protein methylase